MNAYLPWPVAGVLAAVLIVALTAAVMLIVLGVGRAWQRRRDRRWIAEYLKSAAPRNEDIERARLNALAKPRLH